jgi:hypothetical protein
MKRANEGGAFIGTFSSPSGRTRIMLEDDGRVCYAYMIDENGQICSDVWLYNRCQAPAEPEWHSRENAPFANPAPFSCQNSDFGLPRSAEEFSVKWTEAGDFEVAKIYLFDRYLAKLMHGAKPGWSRLAAKDGPLAQTLIEER